MRIPKIAILGLAIECNRFAPPSTRSDFEARALLRGQTLIDEARRQAPRMTPEIPAFVRTMDHLVNWQPMPILWANAESGGPVEHAFFCEVIGDMRRSLESSGPFDGVYICEHGAAVTTSASDPDGEVFALVRKLVGPSVPIVATVDLHANVSERMVDAVDALISYRRNPHTDMADRGIDAAKTLVELMGGMRTSVAHLRLPIVAPPTALLTAPGAGPYADLIEAAEAERDPGIVNISVVGGFAYGDTPQNGLSIIVTTRNDSVLARRAADNLAAIAWRQRDRFAAQLTPIEDAIKRAKEAGEQPDGDAVLLADVADNPGGGGRGNTTYILRALLDADVRDVLFGLFTDPELAAEAHALGEGTSFEARFNRAETARFSLPLSARATVLKLHGGKGIGRRGQLEGCAYDLGQSAALMIDGVILIVITNRHQCH
jgi:microcystin degradation protein MlrC